MAQIKKNLLGVAAMAALAFGGASVAAFAEADNNNLIVRAGPQDRCGQIPGAAVRVEACGSE